MCFGSKPKPQYANKGGYSEESIRPMGEKHAYARTTSVGSVSTTSSVSVTGSQQHSPVSVPLPPPRKHRDSRPASRQSARGAVPNFSSPQPHTYPSQQSRHAPPPQYRAHAAQPAPEYRPRAESRPSPLAPKTHQRQGPPYEHVQRKIQGAQGPGPQVGQKLHAMQTMYVGGW